jgi:hypothetical protein
MTFPRCRLRRRERRRWWWRRSRQTAGIAGRLPSSRCSSSLRPWRWCATQDPKLPIAPTIVVPPDIHLQQPTCPTWAIRFRICRLCLRMEPAPAAALAPAAAAASVRAKVPDSALVTAAAPAAERSTLAVVFPLRKDLCPEPEYSEEARKVKHFRAQCVLWLSRRVRMVSRATSGWLAL